jgi:hypothetical protein
MAWSWSLQDFVGDERGVSAHRLSVWLELTLERFS